MTVSVINIFDLMNQSGELNDARKKKKNSQQLTFAELFNFMTKFGFLKHCIATITNPPDSVIQFISNGDAGGKGRTYPRQVTTPS